MRYKSTLCAMLLSVMPCIVMAAEKPPELATAIHASQPVGQGSLDKFLLHIYDVQFWSDSGDWQKPPYALSITYDMGLTPNEMADRTYEEFRHVSPLPDDQLKHYTEQLRKIYPLVRRGDRITALQTNKQTTQFFANGQPVGEIHDAMFGPAFFAIWLSPHSSEPALQRQLISPHPTDEVL